jgi:hypothetical protein
MMGGLSSLIMQFIGYRTILPVLVLLGGYAGAQTDRVPKEGDRATNFSITTDQRKRISLSAPRSLTV